MEAATSLRNGGERDGGAKGKFSAGARDGAGIDYCGYFFGNRRGGVVGREFFGGGRVAVAGLIERVFGRGNAADFGLWMEL